MGTCAFQNAAWPEAIASGIAFRRSRRCLVVCCRRRRGSAARSARSGPEV